MQANHDKFSAFIEGSKTFVVPVYQRNYDWTVANCKQLFADMTEAVEQNKSHFVGTIVHQKIPSTTFIKSSSLSTDNSESPA